MFGFKLEIWRYDVENYKKAEKHILEMAEKGYELVGINYHYQRVGFYRKTEDTKKRKYYVSLISRQFTDDFLEFYAENGWYLLAQTPTGLGVFYTENPDAKPIFTDVESEEFVGTQLADRQQMEIGCLLAALVPIWGVVTWFMFKVVDWDSGPVVNVVRVLIGIFWIYIIMEAATAVIEERLRNENYILIEQGIPYEKPEWVYKFYGFKLIFTGSLLFGGGLVRLAFMAADGGVMGITIVIATLILAIWGAIFKFYKKNEIAGNSMLMAALFLFLFGDNFMRMLQ